MDSQHNVSVPVTITVLNANDRAPWFVGAPYEITMIEESVPSAPILTLQAQVSNDQPQRLIYECYSSPWLDAASTFDLNPTSGQLTLKRPLNRDLPDGRPVYTLLVSVRDAAHSNIKTYTHVRIVLSDINDNAPVLLYSRLALPYVAGQQRPLTIYEDLQGQPAEFYVYDADISDGPDNKNGAPFTFILDANFTNYFSVNLYYCAECSSQERRFQIHNKQMLTRDQTQRFFVIGYTVSDNAGNARRSSFQLIIGDMPNGGAQADGTKTVTILTYDNNVAPAQLLGTLYVQDERDDWSLATKRASGCVQSQANGSVHTIFNT